MTRSGDSMSRELAGVLGGVLGLCILALVGVQLQENTLARVRRSSALEDADDVLFSDDYDVQIEDEYDEEIIDEWISPNNTRLWKQMQMDLHVELKDEDVTPKARRKKNQGTNWNRLRESQLPQLHDAMVKEFYKHVADLQMFNEISGVDYGKRDPKEMGDEENDEGDYAGYTKTAPIIKDFVDSFGCAADGEGLWNGANKLNFWYLMPNSVPLHSAQDSHVSDYDYYWKFFMKISEKWAETKSDIRFSVGSYGNSAQFTPRGYKFRKNTPWSRMQRYYKKPKMNAAAPKLFSSLRTLLTYLPRYGVSTPSAGTNCVLIWMFQDVPKDISDFMDPEEFQMITELHQMCTVMPVIISPNSDDRTDDAWKKFVANLMPGLQSKYAKDPEYSGAYYVNSFAGLMDSQLHEHIQKYLCLVQNRATCRTCADAWVPPSSDGPGTEAPTAMDLRGIEDDYEAPSTGMAEEEPVATSAGPATEGTTPKIPEIDSCCGHNGYVATPFDSELKTCCGETGTVKAYEFEGSDPCDEVF